MLVRSTAKVLGTVARGSFAAAATRCLSASAQLAAGVGPPHPDPLAETAKRFRAEDQKGDKDQYRKEAVNLRAPPSQQAVNADKAMLTYEGRISGTEGSHGQLEERRDSSDDVVMPAGVVSGTPRALDRNSS